MKTIKDEIKQFDTIVSVISFHIRHGQKNHWQSYFPEDYNGRLEYRYSVRHLQRQWYFWGPLAIQVKRTWTALITQKYYEEHGYHQETMAEASQYLASLSEDSRKIAMAHMR